MKQKETNLGYGEEEKNEEKHYKMKTISRVQYFLYTVYRLVFFLHNVLAQNYSSTLAL